jgi:hypothetical protein
MTFILNELFSEALWMKGKLFYSGSYEFYSAGKLSIPFKSWACEPLSSSNQESVSGWMR